MTISLLPGFTLWKREMVRFLRQRNRVVGALVTPVLFWGLLGSGLGRSFQTPFAGDGHGYLEFFFAGTILLILLFTAIFSTISVIEDRREGFLQAVLVAPVSHVALVIGKVFGGASPREGASSTTSATANPELPKLLRRFLRTRNRASAEYPILCNRQRLDRKRPRPPRKARLAGRAGLRAARTTSSSTRWWGCSPRRES